MHSAKKLLLALSASCAAAVASFAVTITFNGTTAYTRSAAGSVALNGFTGLSIPASFLLDANQSGYDAQDQIDYTGSGDNVTLQNKLSTTRAGGVGGSSYVESVMRFTVASNASYSLSGNFSAIDVSTPGYLFIQVFLQDMTAGTTLYNNDQYSRSTLDESFVLGGSGGDWGNDTSGSMTGFLISGHQYQWYSIGLSQAYPDADGGTSAAGFFRLDIGGGAPSSGSSVPDSGATSALLGLAVLALAAGRRKLLS